MTPSPQVPATPPAKKPFPVVLIVVIVAVAMCCPVTGILAAIAIPNFIKYQSRAKQLECKSNLRVAFAAEEAYRAEKDAYDTDANKVGFTPSNNRYVYLFSKSGTPETIVEAAHPEKKVSASQALAAVRGINGLGLEGECPACEITIACVGNIDNDDDLDVWSISSAERELGDEMVPAGSPYQHQDDLGLKGRNRRGE